MNNEPVAHFYPEGEGCTVYDIKFAWKVQGTTEPIPLYTHPANPKYDPETGEPLIDGYPLFSGLPLAKTLTDEEWNKAFDFYCETDEGVLKFDLELRDEWKKEQLIRWKEAIRKAQEK